MQDYRQVTVMALPKWQELAGLSASWMQVCCFYRLPTTAAQSAWPLNVAMHMVHNCMTGAAETIVCALTEHTRFSMSHILCAVAFDKPVWLPQGLRCANRCCRRLPCHVQQSSRSTASMHTLLIMSLLKSSTFKDLHLLCLQIWPARKSGDWKCREGRVGVSEERGNSGVPCRQ